MRCESSGPWPTQPTNPKTDEPQVIEFWHQTPDDGHVYYVVRPPWVTLDTLQAYFTLHPEERHYSTGVVAQVRMDVCVCVCVCVRLGGGGALR